MPGFDNGVMFADNVDFRGAVSSGSAQVTSDGQLLIGSAVFPNIRIGTLGSSDGSITWTVGHGTITGQVTGGSTTAKTITGDNAVALSPTLGNWNILGQTSGSGSTAVMDTIGSGSTLKIEDRTWQTEYVVDPSSSDGLKGTFTTIQAAINAAAADGTSTSRVKTIFVRKGTYTENLTMPANSIHITANTPNGYFSIQTSTLYDVSIVGNITFTAGAVAHFSNLYLLTSDNSAPINNSNAINILNLTNCQLNTTGGTDSLVNSSTVGQGIRLNNVVFAGGNINSSDTVIANSCYFQGATFSGGIASIYNSTLTNPSTFSTTCNFYGCTLGNGTITFTTSSSTTTYFGCYFKGAVTLTGAGTIKYCNCTFDTVARTFSSTTISPLATTNDAIHITTPGAYPYTTLANDAVILVDTSSGRTITPMASPVTGQKHIIKDNVGSAATNNITVTPSGKNIDGSASYTINVNYGSITIVYNGSEWSII